MSSQTSTPPDPRPYSPIYTPGRLAPPNMSRYLDQDDKVVVSVQNLVAVTVGVRLRWQDLDGGVHLENIIVAPATVDGTLATTTVGLGAGFLLSASAFIESGTPRRGQCFVSAGISRSTFLCETFFADYLVQGQPLGWPYGRILQSIEGAGNVRVVSNAAPAAGGQFTITVPANTRWRVQALRASLQTSAVVANRQAHLQVQDSGGNVANDTPQSSTQAASLTRGYSYSQVGYFANALDGELLAGIAPLILNAGMKLVSTVTAMDGGDQWGIQRLLVEEWIEQ
jgi:hypothetical protein